MSMTRNYNFIKEIAAFPCAQPNPIIWFVTFAPAVAPALIEFISYGCRDIVKFRAGVGTPCGRLLKGAARAGWSPQALNAARTFFKFSLPLERALFWWFVADLASDTAARWTSLAYQLSGCDPAKEGASWEYDGAPPGTLLPDDPTIVAGFLRNVQGRPGVAWPTGALCPAGWYLQLAFTVTLKPFLMDGQITPHTWLHSNLGTGYDFPAQSYPKGYPGQSISLSYVMQTKNPSDTGPTLFTMYAMTDRMAQITNLTGAGHASPLPVLDWSLSPLGCLRDLGIADTPNPAGRNPPASRQPTIFDPFLPSISPPRQ